MKKLILLFTAIIMFSSCSKEEAEEIDFRENNPEYAKLEVEGKLINLSGAGKDLSMTVKRNHIIT